MKTVIIVILCGVTAMIVGMLPSVIAGAVGVRDDTIPRWLKVISGVLILGGFVIAMLGAVVAAWVWTLDVL